MKFSNTFFKRLIAASLAALMVLTLGGCNKKENSDQPVIDAHLTPEEASKYVITLGNYSGIEVDLSTKENVQAMQSALSACTPLQIKDRAVEEGDTVNIEYTGRYESTGETFEGGSASGASLTIGSGSFIPGFEEGLIGVMPHDPVDLYLTFPKDYHNAEFAGVKVIFSVFVNYIEGYSEEDIEAAEKSVAVANVVDKAMEETVFAEQLPNAFVDAKVNLLVSEVEASAASVNMDLQTYLASYFQMTVEEMKEQALEYATMEAQTEIMYLAIAHKEGISISEEEYNTELKRLAEEYGYKEDTAKFIEDFGGEEDVKNAIFLMKISDHIGSLNTIKK